MKAKELMLGDWVYRQDYYDQVKEIRCTGVIGIDGMRGLITFSELEPIPLTLEILEKNGFQKKGHRYGIYDDYSDFEMYEYNDGTWLVSYHCCEMSLPDEQLLICHVHKLQHFMRHCGIGKEIVL